MQLAEQLRAAGLPCFPCRADKAPAVSKDEDWNDVARRPVMACYWPTGVVGVPVPAGLVVVDLDTYKGITREAVDAAVPWDDALVQTTQRGGQHYAFRVPAGWNVRQGSNVGGLQGLDTRVGGKGYVATGDGYTPHGPGVYRLAAPAGLPVLPDSLRALLEAPDHTASPPPPPSTHQPGDTDPDTVRAALRHVDPGCGRSEWLDVLMALRAIWPDDEATGAALAEEWSAGELWPGGCPSNYEAEGRGSATYQFHSVKPTGGVGPGTLYHYALAGGWMPPRTLDTAAAFGAGAMPGGEFVGLLERIQAEGGNPAYTEELTQAVHTAPCNATQRAVLAAVLQRELKDVGLGTRAVRQAIEPPAGEGAGYGKNHTTNARLWLGEHAQGGTLIRSEQVFYQYTGKVWRPITDGALEARVAHAMTASRPQNSTVSGTAGMIGKLVHTDDAPPGHSAPGVAVFENGVLHFGSGTLSPHSPDYPTTCLLPYDYVPAAQCPEWQRFLAGAFGGDGERIALLQEWFGYMLAPGYDHHKMLLLIGAPRCGKGTIGRVLELVVGEDNYSGGSLSDFTNSSVLNLWRHKTVLFIGDAQNGVPRTIRDVVIERLKQVSGNDKVAFDRKWKDAANCTLPTRVTIAANGLPRLFDDSGALASRIMPLPVDGSHLGHEDLGLFGRLSAEVEGIAQWALQGLARLQAQGRFTEPQASAGERQYMIEAYSPIAAFLADCAVYGEGESVASSDLYAEYVKWCTVTGDDVRLPQRAVTAAVKQAVAARGVKYRAPMWVDGRSVRGFEGMGLRPVTAAAFDNVVQIGR